MAQAIQCAPGPPALRPYTTMYLDKTWKEETRNRGLKAQEGLEGSGPGEKMHAQVCRLLLYQGPKPSRRHSYPGIPHCSVPGALQGCPHRLGNSPLSCEELQEGQLATLALGLFAGLACFVCVAPGGMCHRYSRPKQILRPCWLVRNRP